MKILLQTSTPLKADHPLSWYLKWAASIGSYRGYDCDHQQPVSLQHVSTVYWGCLGWLMGCNHLER
jgi:hypothetical protein